MEPTEWTMVSKTVYFLVDPWGKETSYSYDEATIKEKMREKNQWWYDLENVARRKIDTELYTALPEDTYLRYSCWYEDVDGIPVNNLQETAVKGECFLKYGNFTSKRLVYPTWLDVCKEVDLLLRLNYEKHYIFFEGLDKIDDFTYAVLMGS